MAALRIISLFIISLALIACVSDQTQETVEKTPFDLKAELSNLVEKQESSPTEISGLQMILR